MPTRSDVIDIAAGRFQPSLAEEFGSLRAELAAVERRLECRMFILWVAQVLAQFGILWAFFRT